MKNIDIKHYKAKDSWTYPFEFMVIQMSEDDLCEIFEAEGFLSFKFISTGGLKYCCEQAVLKMYKTKEWNEDVDEFCRKVLMSSLPIKFINIFKRYDIKDYSEVIE